MKKTFKITLGLLGLLMVLMVASCKRIDAGHTGVKFNYYGITDEKGISERELVSGMVWYNPFTRGVYEYPHFWQQVTFERISFNSIEGEPITTDLSIVYRFGREDIAQLFDEYRESPGDLEDGIVREIVLKALNDRAGDLNAVDIMGRQRDELLFNVQESLNKEYNSMFEFDLVNFSSDLMPSNNVKEAIQGVIQAQESAKRAQAATIEVREQAAQAVLRARGDSSATVIQAAGEARRMELVQKQLAQSPLYIDYIKAQAWNGILPIYTGGPIPMLSID